MTNDQRARIARGLTTAGERLQFAGDALVELGTLFAELGQPAIAEPTPVPAPAPKLHKAAEPDRVQPATILPSRDGLNGRQWYDEIKRDAPLLKRAQSIGKAQGYGWQILSWDAHQVAQVKLLLESKMPGDRARSKAVR